MDSFENAIDLSVFASAIPPTFHDTVVVSVDLEVSGRLFMANE